MPVTCLERERPRSLALVTAYPYSCTGACMHVCEGIWGVRNLDTPLEARTQYQTPSSTAFPHVGSFFCFLSLVDLTGFFCLSSKYWGYEHMYNLHTYMGPGDSKSGLNVHTENT